jgi:hypothetical protein
MASSPVAEAPRALTFEAMIASKQELDGQRQVSSATACNDYRSQAVSKATMGAKSPFAQNMMALREQLARMVRCG